MFCIEVGLVKDRLGECCGGSVRLEKTARNLGPCPGKLVLKQEREGAGGLVGWYAEGCTSVKDTTTGKRVRCTMYQKRRGIWDGTPFEKFNKPETTASKGTGAT